MVIEQYECLKCGCVYDECNCNDKPKRIYKAGKHKETSYGSTSDEEDKQIVGSNSYKRINAKYNRDIKNELDRVLNRNGKK